MNCIFRESMTQDSNYLNLLDNKFNDYRLTWIYSVFMYVIFITIIYEI